MRRLAFVFGLVLIALGLASLAGGAVTWKWGDPVTAIYTQRAQARLDDELATRRRELRERAAAAAPTSGAKGAAARDVRALARAYRASLGEGDAVGRLRVPRLGRDPVVVLGPDDATLRDGPGLHRAPALPGQGRLVYVAGHRTTYGAPFAHVDRLRPGDEATVETPYGTFRYRVIGTRVVEEDDLSVLGPTPGEVLRLQACHPRFRATQRMVVSAVLEGSSAPA